MIMTQKNVINFLMVVMVILIIVLPMNLSSDLTYRLYSSNLNLLLLLVLIGLVSGIDNKLGIMLTFLVLVTYSMKDNEGFENMPSMYCPPGCVVPDHDKTGQNPNDYYPTSIAPEAPQIAEESSVLPIPIPIPIPITEVPLALPTPITEELPELPELPTLRDNKNTIKENFPRDTVPVHPKAPVSLNTKLEGFTNNISKNNELLTQEFPKIINSQDVTGCRYDHKNSPQNTTMYGPPLSECTTYNSTNIQETGTVFYPLNA